MDKVGDGPLNFLIKICVAEYMRWRFCLDDVVTISGVAVRSLRGVANHGTWGAGLSGVQKRESQELVILCVYG